MSPEAKAAFAAAAAAAAASDDPTHALLMAADFAAIGAGAAAPRLFPQSSLDVLTLPQAAEYLSVTEDVVRSEAEAGRLIGRKIGGDWRFLRECIVEWLRTPQRPSRPAAGLGAKYADEDPEEVIASIYRERRKSRSGD